ncbi:GIY-YIG nuclease family protein [bacterium]|jgi:excinuclease ABC subunit C|nr:GIY-YIG nuclease family protein [bacterium]MBT4251563.1 GIY-YIG nuclease family protein [bacterium]MBT4597612.1 GIY-YIG nuclease family protein [bacterium]MBT6753626.1 GIY-YIG nuclease family protein [bacterium]MBT7037763.1 GIY-YIG nuclease family protein [bacterium]
MSNLFQNQLKNLSTKPGVYLFYGVNKTTNKEDLLYIGKATALKSRVSSYFRKKINYERPIEFVISQIKRIEVREAESVLEAYFLEQEMIGALQPKYNVMGKDDKSFVYVAVTKEDFPRFEIYRKTDLEQGLVKDNSRIFGPFTAKHLIERALKILRKIFPYHDRKEKTEKGCLDFQLGLCPGPYDGQISKRDYAKNIKAIELMFLGKKKVLIRKIQREMDNFAKKNEFEKAAKLRNQLFALRHIQDMAMISDRNKQKLHSSKRLRIEGYDISNTGKNQIVGSMVVFDNQFGTIEANKKEYRKFKIRGETEQNDLAAMKELLVRRFSNDWAMPDLLVIDGGSVHLRLVRDLLVDLELSVPILAVAKGPTRKKLDIFSYGDIPKITKKTIAEVRDEAHRFAISYHRALRGKAMLQVNKK